MSQNNVAPRYHPFRYRGTALPFFNQAPVLLHVFQKTCTKKMLTRFFIRPLPVYASPVALGGNLSPFISLIVARRAPLFNFLKSPE